MFNLSHPNKKYIYQKIFLGFVIIRFKKFLFFGIGLLTRDRKQDIIQIYYQKIKYILFFKHLGEKRIIISSRFNQKCNKTQIKIYYLFVVNILYFWENLKKYIFVQG